MTSVSAPGMDPGNSKYPPLCIACEQGAGMILHLLLGHLTQLGKEPGTVKIEVLDHAEEAELAKVRLVFRPGALSEASGRPVDVFDGHITIEGEREVIDHMHVRAEDNQEIWQALERLRRYLVMPKPEEGDAA